MNAFPVAAKWWGILGNISTHNAYHIGQIVYIRKLQKVWITNEYMRLPSGASFLYLSESELQKTFL